jgi:hypothetical protein
VISNLDYRASAPGTAARLFETRELAQGQPIGNISLVFDENSFLICNEDFKEDLIIYDTHYLSTVQNLASNHLPPTLEYFDKLISTTFSFQPTITDIGCGQGEFVKAIEHKGFEALGFDTALRCPGANLFNVKWEPGMSKSDLFVMRCVLPHIPNPFQFLDELFLHHPKSKVLVEYQSLEWLFEKSSWNQLSHDHVNIFTINSFKDYSILASGKFSSGEWEFVLLGPSTRSLIQAKPNSLTTYLSRSYSLQFRELMERREQSIDRLAKMSSQIVIWGGAGKGAVLALALREAKIENVICVDADPLKQGSFLPCSGVEILPHTSIKARADPKAIYLVSNPLHFLGVKKFLGEGPNVISLDNKIQSDFR